MLKTEKRRKKPGSCTRTGLSKQILWYVAHPGILHICFVAGTRGHHRVWISLAEMDIELPLPETELHDFQGVDGLVEVPFTRWELEEVWDPNPDALGKMHLG